MDSVGIPVFEHEADRDSTDRNSTRYRPLLGVEIKYGNLFISTIRDGVTPNDVCRLFNTVNEGCGK